MTDSIALNRALAGKILSRFTWYEGELYVATSDGSYRLSPVGDCCSQCYVQHVSGTLALKPGARVVSVEDIGSVPTDAELAAADVLEAWGHRIITDRGLCSIEMRLDHNGYYGGALEVEPFTGDSLPGDQVDDF